MHQRHRDPASAIDHRAFTLFELLIATAVIGLLLASVIPWIAASREESNRVTCRANLAAVRNALTNYKTANHTYPRVRYDTAAKPEGWTAFTGPDDANPFAATSAVRPNDVTASLWLLVRGDYVTDTGVFVCPSTDDWPDRLYDARGASSTAAARGNFRSGHHLSYSAFCMFGVSVKDGWTDTLHSGCALLADKSPGVTGGDDVTRPPADAQPEAFAVANSRNHGRAGQNVLYADGSVQFERNPYVGDGYQRAEKNPTTGVWQPLIHGDNIYTALRATPLPAGDNPPATGQGAAGQTVGPAWPYDTYLVPTAGDE